MSTVGRFELPMNCDHIPGFYNCETIMAYDKARRSSDELIENFCIWHCSHAFRVHSAGRDELNGKYVGEAQTAVLNRDMYLKFWHKYPSMLNTAFMSCAVDSYSDLVYYSKFPLLIDDRICYFRFRSERKLMDRKGKPRQNYSTRRTSFNEKDAPDAPPRVYGKSVKPSQYNLEGQRWILECESKPACDIGILDRVPMFTRDWGYKPFAEFRIGEQLSEIQSDLQDQKYLWGKGSDDAIPYTSFADCHFASVFRHKAYRWSAAGRDMAKVVPTSLKWILLLVCVLQMAQLLGFLLPMQLFPLTGGRFT
jgi:hypothetical protein